MADILIVEDHEDVSRMLAEALLREGHRVKSAFSGAEGREELDRNRYDLILLDLMLPFGSGDELLREARIRPDTAVIVVSAKDRVETKVELLKLGADDYVTKPFDLNEVTARVESQLRRLGKLSQAQGIHRYKDLSLNEATKRVEHGGTALTLTAKEYRILELLMTHEGKVFTKANLYESLWNEEYAGDDNAVKTHISNLRSKLKRGNPEESYIETVWGLGYRLHKG